MQSLIHMAVRPLDCVTLRRRAVTHYEQRGEQTASGGISEHWERVTCPECLIGEWTWRYRGKAAEHAIQGGIWQPSTS